MSGLLFEPVTEGLHPDMAGTVNQLDWSPARQGRRHHGQQWRDADAPGDQQQRLGRRLQDELASRRKDLQHGAFMGLSVQEARDQATRLMLDADAIALTLTGRRDRIVAPVLDAVQGDAQAQILAGLGDAGRQAVDRFQVEGADLFAFRLNQRDAERASAAPASRRVGLGRIALLFGADQQIGQLAIGCGPGVDHRIGGHLGAQHLANALQQGDAHQRIVIRLDLQGDVLVDDLLDQRSQGIQAIDVASVHQHCPGQCPRLGTAGLVGTVEQRTDLGVVVQQFVVEVPGQGFTAGFQQRNGGLDDGLLLG